jgi:hypothetical protein
MEPMVGASQMSRAYRMKNQDKTRSDHKLTPEMLGVIESLLKRGDTQLSIAQATGVNTGSVSTIKLVLKYLRRL